MSSNQLKLACIFVLIATATRAETDYTIVASKLERSIMEVADVQAAAMVLSTSSEGNNQQCVKGITEDINNVKISLEREKSDALKAADYNDPHLTKAFGSLLKGTIEVTAKYISGLADITSKRAKLCYSRSVDTLANQAVIVFRRAQNQLETVRQELPD